MSYKWRDKRLAELQATATDEGVRTIARVEVALQKKLTNGKCAWWSGTKFGATGKNCKTMRWLPMKHRPTAGLYFLKVGTLASSVKTKTKNYSAWTRATDTVGNIETTFTRGRNLSTFEVKRKG